MEGLRCAVCRDRFVIGEKVQLIANITVVDGKYSFDINEEDEQEICAIHPDHGTIVLLYNVGGEARSMVILAEKGANDGN